MRRRAVDIRGQAGKAPALQNEPGVVVGRMDPPDLLPRRLARGQPGAIPSPTAAPARPGLDAREDLDHTLRGLGLPWRIILLA
jgi:hypothetical protein